MYPHTLLISIEHQRGHREWKWSRLSNFFCLRSGAMATLPKALAFSAAHRRTIQSGWVSSGFGCFVVFWTWIEHFCRALVSVEAVQKMCNLNTSRNAKHTSTCTLCLWVKRSCLREPSWLSSGGILLALTGFFLLQPAFSRSQYHKHIFN